MERLIKEGDNPVLDILGIISRHLSRPEHEEFWLNSRGPSRKAKYYRETDSEPVPGGTGEKHLEQRSEIVPETMCLQAVGARKCDGVPFA